MSSGYIYLLQPLRSITDNKNVYKIGKTKRNNYKRFNEYPSGSILLLQSSCENCDLMERKLLKIFDEKFIKKTDYGREYFEGNLIEMKKIINYEIINEEDIDISISLCKDVAVDEVVGISSIDVVCSDDFRSVKSTDDDNNILLKSFNCELCNFTTSKKGNYNSHLLTSKHKLQISDKKGKMDDFICSVCSKKYKSRVGLWSHKKKCFKEKKIEYEFKEKMHNTILNNSLILQILNDNKEFKNMIIENKKDCNKFMNAMMELMQNKVAVCLGDVAHKNESV